MAVILSGSSENNVCFLPSQQKSTEQLKVTHQHQIVVMSWWYMINGLHGERQALQC